MNCDRQGILEVFLNPCMDFRDRIIPVFNAVPPEGPKDHSRPNIHFQPFSEISSDCRVMMLCTADEIFYVEEHYSETQFFADL